MASLGRFGRRLCRRGWHNLRPRFFAGRGRVMATLTADYFGGGTDRDELVGWTGFECIRCGFRTLRVAKGHWPLWPSTQMNDAPPAFHAARRWLEGRPHSTRMDKEPPE